MRVFEVSPRGYCLGVISAIELAKKVAKDNPNKQITILGMLVHNKFVNQDLSKLGIQILDNKGLTRMELLDLVNEGIVIMSAHGVSDEVIEKAKSKGLEVFDSTCTYVRQTHNLIKEKIADGYTVLYLGQQGHPESEGAVAINNKIKLIQCKDELPTDGKKYFITNQTTLSYDFVQDVYDKAKELNIEVANEICNATRTRQEAIKNIPGDVDILIVVGDTRSNNTKKLAELAKEYLNDVYLVESVSDIDDNWFNQKMYCAITSGASTPTNITNEVIEYIKKRP